MLRKLLHWSLLLVAIVLSLIAARAIWREEKGREPAEVAAMIEADLRERVQEAAVIEEHKDDILEWIDGRIAPASPNIVGQLPYLLFAAHGDSLMAWNTAAVLPPFYMADSAKLYYLTNGIHYGYRITRDWLPKGYTLSLLFPITQQYPISNEYLKPSILASPYIEPDMRIADTPGPRSAPLHALDGSVIGYVHHPPSGDMPEPPALPIVWCWLLSLVAFAAWLHSWASRLSRQFGVVWGAALVIMAAVGIRLLLLLKGLPFDMAESEFFSPRLYAASNWLPSLGDLLLHVLTILWILLFIAPRLHFHLPRVSKPWCWLIAILLGLLLFGSGILFVRLIRSLVLNSLIPFDTQHLSVLDGNALSGLLIAALLLSVVLIIADSVRNGLRALLRNGWSQLAVLAISTGLLWLLRNKDPLLPVYGVATLWLSIVILGQHITRLREGAGIFRVGNLFWSVGHCLLLTFLIQQYSRVREGQARRHFAEHIATRHDDAMEYNFGQLLTSIRTDTLLQEFLQEPNIYNRTSLEEHFATRYFASTLSAYQPTVYVFDPAGTPLLNLDTTSLANLQLRKEIAIPSRTASDLYFLESAPDDHVYLAILPVLDSNESLLGTLAIDLEQKKIVSETVLPELLQPEVVNQAEKAARYSYAIYSDRRLVAQTSDYPFPFYIPVDTSKSQYRERYGKDFSTLVYTPDTRRSVSVWKRFGTLSEALMLFSYLLLIRYLLLAVSALYGQARTWVDHPEEAIRQARGIGLRKRLQFSIMGIVAISFIAIGVATVAFLRQQYDNTNKARRQAMMQSVTRAIQQYMREHRGDNNSYLWQSTMATPDFRYFLTNLASSQKIDINLFDANGHLTNTTQPAIFDQGLMAPIMRYDVLQGFFTQPRPLVTELEHIGTLQYQSCYVPLRDARAQIVSILNVPLFYAQRELEEQISGVVVALVNLYAAALLLSGLLAFFITGWVTRAFDVIIRQFGRMNIKGNNELLQWPYDDEIGVLVAEYNKMVRKVEESVAMLAKNEREGAFREMARQVAHEIKNPLTPMSLYVQRLQQAIASGHPDVVDLARRVSDALLEQINNLSVIATEFGDFARIGSARPEQIDLAEIVKNVVGPFAADASVQVSFDAPDAAIYVMADRSQLVRIMTNLLKNAIQAIPEQRAGVVEVALRQEGAQAVISVADNGTGISAETQEKLFTPYFTTKSSGTGLGLAMTRQMVEAWGGRIWYETEPDQGTRFFIALPVVSGA